jgi:hypothetical protein
MGLTALSTGRAGGGESPGIKRSAWYGWSGSVLAKGTRPGDSDPSVRPVKKRHHVQTRLERFQSESLRANPWGNR